MNFPDLSHHRTYGSVYGGSINLTCNTSLGVVIYHWGLSVNTDFFPG